ncbi:hypothetical protein XELAEV_18005598mg [Xenopus laevis]|uniref:Uncharacterized protein n=1 Tax=Xenopus laevis TaxID=8355 RepID=A0A974DXX9_XENLA|nr:hypothetical protein XELAEV_18005598mg [Xenopus laevis]
MSFQEISSLTKEKADTYSFTNEERDRILQSAILHTSDFQGIQSPADKKQRLEELNKKQLTLTLHSTTLTEYAKVQRIPRGLRIKNQPALLKDNIEYLEKWQQILNKASLDLIFLTIQYLQPEIRKVTQDITKVNEELKACLAENEYVTLTAKMNASIESLQAELLRSKLRKFKRDTEDYSMRRVYSWHLEKRQTRYWPRRERKQRENQASDVTSDTGESSLDSAEERRQGRRNHEHWNQLCCVASTLYIDIAKGDYNNILIAINYSQLKNNMECAESDLAVMKRELVANPEMLAQCF